MTDNSVTIIAEAGVNHNGSVETAKELCQAGHDAGADMVKFQIFSAEQLVTPEADKAQYQKQQTDSSENQLQMLKELELSVDEFKQISNYCQNSGIEDLYSVFGVEDVQTLLELEKEKVKIPSGEITNGPLLLEVARQGFSVILSTGMSTLSEVQEALSVLTYGYLSKVRPSSQEDFKDILTKQEAQSELASHVSLLHCTSEYPASVDEVNLRTINKLEKEFNLPAGLSDHTKGIIIPIAAVGRGAKIIEKHFTLDKDLPGPDHQASLEPQEFTQMTESIKKAEKALGEKIKQPTQSEFKNRKLVRKSLVALQKIEKGEEFTKEVLTSSRPGRKVSPMKFWNYLDQQARHNYSPGDFIEPRN